ncbi:unnamed protein product [Pylaiella littoralis]
MKRARDGNTQQEEQEIPPPPPPRTRPPLSGDGMQQQQQQQQQQEQEIPPPPPPRRRPPSSRSGCVAANEFSSHAAAASTFHTVAAWSGTNGNTQPNGGGVGGIGANVFSCSSPSVASSSSVHSYAGPKRAKIGVGQLDDFVLTAGIGVGVEGESSNARVSADGASTRGGGRGGDDLKHLGKTTPARSKRRFAVVCSANFNRSMMAHELLQKHNFQVESYGTSKDLRLPGKDITSPEVFAFGTPYRSLYDTLKRKDEAFFLKNNLLRLAARNATVKAAPQRFQDIEGPDMADFDVVLCFEARVFYSVVEDLQSRDPEEFKPLHVINMTIKDSFEESAAASGNVLELCRTLDGLSKLEDEAAGVLEAFTRKSKRTVLHQVCHV